MKAWLRIGLGIIVLSCWLTAAAAANTTEIQHAWAEARQVGTKGPAEVSLGSQGTLKLPEHCVYLTRAQAGKLLDIIGATTSAQILGLVISDSSDTQWYVTVTYANSGHVPAKYLENPHFSQGIAIGIKKAMDKANEERRQRGLPEEQFINWIEKPQYNLERHQIIYCIAIRQTSADVAPIDCVLYNASIIGQDGTLSLSLITVKAHMEAQKPIVQTLLNNMQFMPGKGYDDKPSPFEKGEKLGRMMAPIVIIVAILAFFAIGVGVGLFIYFKNRNNRDQNGPVA